LSCEKTSKTTCHLQGRVEIARFNKLKRKQETKWPLPKDEKRSPIEPKKKKKPPHYSTCAVTYQAHQYCPLFLLFFNSLQHHKNQSKAAKLISTYKFVWFCSLGMSNSLLKTQIQSE
jgi:hypothetical protein